MNTMLNDIEFVDPFPKTFRILQTRVDLPHAEIAQWCKDTLEAGKGEDGFRGQYTSYFYPELNEFKLHNRAPWYPEFRQLMIEGAELFLTHIGAQIDIKRHRKVGAWWSVYKEGDRHQMHNHPNCLVAGTYYPHASKASTKIRYRSPMYPLITMSDLRAENTQLFDVKPETGMMNFWSPWLDHEILPQAPVEEGDERVAISFNYGSR